MDRQRVGIQIGATTSPSDLGAVVAEAERLGYGEAWLAEDYFELGGVAETTIALAATGEIPIGLGVVAAPARHPAVTAMEFATVGAAFPGRFMAGLGHGAPGWLDQMGLRPASPLRLLRETIGAIRDLLEGEEVSRNGGYFTFDRVKLTHPPEDPIPLYLGVHGPASLRLSGELADGTLLGWFSSPDYVVWARERIDEGRQHAGRTDAHQLVALCVLSISKDDPESALREIGGWARPMLAAMGESPQMKASQVRNELAESLAASGDSEILPEPLLSQFVAAGDATMCRRMVDRLLEAGADRVVLVPNPGGLRSTSAMVAQIRMGAGLLDAAG